MFAIGLCVVLFLAFPSQDLSQKLARAQRSDLLTISYLRAWLSAQPREWPLYLTLSRHLTLIGRYDDALDALKPLRDADPGLRDRATQQRIVILERKAWSLPEDSEERARLFAELARERGPSAPVPAAPGTTPLELAMGAQDPATALARLRAQIADAGLRRPAAWFAEMGTLAQAQNELPLAGQCYWRAFDASETVAARRGYLRDTMRVMRWAGREAEFLDQLVPRLALAQPDTALYQELVRIALGARRPDLAEQWARELLRFSMGLQRWLAATRTGQATDGAPGARADTDAAARWGVRAQTVAARAPRAVRAAAGAKTAPPRGRDAVSDRRARGAKGKREVSASAGGKAGSARAAATITPVSMRRTSPAPVAEARAVTRVAATPTPAPAPASTLALATPSLPTPDPSRTRPTTMPEPAMEGPHPQLPFDDAAYRLAYEVFVGNRNLADALRVADAAVRMAPQSRVWRERLAQVAEWSSRSPIALTQWRTIAEQTGERAAWQQVQRLALATHDHDALLAYLRWHAQSSPPSDELDLKVATTYEFLGQPDKAITWLRSRIEARGAENTRTLRDRVTDLAQLAGKVGLLEEQLRGSLRADGPRLDLTMRLATLLFTQGRLQDAFEVLQGARPEALDPQRYGAAQEKTVGFWDLHTRLATRLQREDDAILSFLQRMRLQAASADDLRELSLLAEGRSLRAAADVSEFAWYQHRDPDQLERLFGLLLGLRDYARLERVLDSLSAQQRSRFESDPSLLRARADHRQSLGRFADARRDLERSIELEPTEPSGPAQLLWMLLAQRDAPAMRQALARFEPMALQAPVLWAPVGAALLAMNEPQRALRYFHLKARDSNDYLWWLAYADALSDAGRHDAAWTLRRRAWTELRPAAIAGRHDARMATRDRVVALALQFSPSDDARRLLKGMLVETAAMASATPAQSPDIAAPAPVPSDLPALAERIVGLLPTRAQEDQPVEPPPPVGDNLQAAVRELVVSYLMTRESFDAARGWLLSRYASDLTRPAWAELALALLGRDRVRLERLLDDMPDWLPKLESIDAMRETRRYASAQTLAFETLGSRPDNPDAHQRVLDTFAEAGSFAQVGVGGLTQGALGIHGLRAETRWAATSGWSVLAEFDQLRLRTSDTEQLQGLPEMERRLALGVRRPIEDGWWVARVSHREGVRDVLGAQLQWQLGTPGRWQIAGVAGLRQTAHELALLRAGGSKDHLDVRLTWEATGRDYLALSVAGTRFRTQIGTALGDGLSGALEFGHRLRLDYPDVTIRLSLARATYDAERRADALVTGMIGGRPDDPFSLWVPASSSQANLSLAIGETANHAHSRAWRPYAEAGLRSNSITGTGYNLRAGLTGSLLGADRLTLFASSISAVPGNPRGSRELVMSYRWRY